MWRWPNGRLRPQPARLIVAFTRGAWIGGAVGVVLVGVVAGGAVDASSRLDRRGDQRRPGHRIIWRSLSNPNDVIGTRQTSRLHLRVPRWQRPDAHRGDGRRLAAIEEELDPSDGRPTPSVGLPRFSLSSTCATQEACPWPMTCSYPLQLGDQRRHPGIVHDVDGVFVWAAIVVPTVFGAPAIRPVVRRRLLAAVQGHSVQLLVGLCSPTPRSLWPSLVRRAWPRRRRFWI